MLARRPPAAITEVGSRWIPTPEPETLDLTPTISLAKPLSPYDRPLVEALRRELQASGLIPAPERTTSAFGSEEEVTGLMKEASTAAVHEEHLHPAYYAAAVDAALGDDLPEEEDWASNPFMEEALEEE